MNRLKVGDLVKLLDSHDNDRQIGVVVDISPRAAHLVSHGSTFVIRVYWPTIGETDWEYDFFLELIESEALTKEE